MFKAGWNSTSCQGAVNDGEDARTGCVKNLFQESSGDNIKGAGHRFHRGNYLCEGG